MLFNHIILLIVFSENPRKTGKLQGNCEGKLRKLSYTCVILRQGDGQPKKEREFPVKHRKLCYNKQVILETFWPRGVYYTSFTYIPDKPTNNRKPRPIWHMHPVNRYPRKPQLPSMHIPLPSTIVFTIQHHASTLKDNANTVLFCLSTIVPSVAPFFGSGYTLLCGRGVALPSCRVRVASGGLNKCVEVFCLEVILHLQH